MPPDANMHQVNGGGCAGLDTTTAVRSEDGIFAYADLLAAANAASMWLRDANAGLSPLIGIAVSRGFDRLAAMLAVWKVGGAVLALDPAWPPEHMQAIVADARPALVLTDTAAVPIGTCREVAFASLRGDRALGMQAGASHRLGMADADGLAYVVYTSGSSGRSKGVEIGHRNLANLVGWHNREFAITSQDRVAHLAGLGFDAAFWEVVPALCAGAALCIPDEESRTSPARLQRWLLDEGVTVAFVPTVMAEALFGAEWPAHASLRVLLTGGERLRMRPPSNLPFSVYNNYGPSECTVVTTCGLVAAEDDGTEPDIGRPIDNVRVWLLDAAGKLAAQGEIGEICIGGAGVGVGYRNATQPSRPAFVGSLLAATDSGAMYRSGDLGRYLPDGRIAFMGRLDDQEQIRGVRVEPAEIEAVLGRHPAIEWSRVVAADSPRGRELTAYILLRANCIPTSEQLGAFLAAKLPPAMVPSCFMQVQAIPMTPNGKLDLAALANGAGATKLPRASFRAPCSPMERQIAVVLETLLKTADIGCDDNFFLLGGHSLLGTQVVVRIREAFGIQLALRDVFSFPTVTGLVHRVTQLLTEHVARMSDDEVQALMAD